MSDYRQPKTEVTGGVLFSARPDVVASRSWRWLSARIMTVCLAVGVLTGVSCLVSPDAAHAQTGWDLPWDKPAKRRQRPRRPAPSQDFETGSNIDRRSDICLQLEQKLVLESSQGTTAFNQLPLITKDISRYTKEYRDAKRQLKRKKCYDTFLFVKTLRSTRRCRRLARKADDAKERVRDLEAQKKQIRGGARSTSYQDEIISDLARYRCGANYRQEARRRSRKRNPFSSSFWQDNDSVDSPAPYNRYGALPFATYRTLCVRICDGYYFPVSFSTLPNHFQRDANVCQSKCAAPVDLYYHQNPGGSVEQMVSATQSTPYTQLPSAFRYRKEYVRGCSCKLSEYQPEGSDPNQKADAGGFRTTIEDPLIQR